LLLITRGPQLQSRGVGLGNGGRALFHATDDKKKCNSGAKRSDWQDSRMKPLDGGEFLNSGKDLLPCSVHLLLLCMIHVTRGSDGGLLTGLMGPRVVSKSMKVLAQQPLQILILEFEDYK